MIVTIELPRYNVGKALKKAAKDYREDFEEKHETSPYSIKVRLITVTHERFREYDKHKNNYKFEIEIMEEKP